MLELPFHHKNRKQRRKIRPAKSREVTFEARLRERLEEARIEFVEARSRLTGVVQNLTGEIQSHLSEYAVQNVLREIRKTPDRYNLLREEERATFHEELKSALESETLRIVNELKENPEWYDGMTIFLNEKSRAWKTIKSVDNTLNRIMRKYGLGAVNTAGWTWLSESLNDIAINKFPTIKKFYIEKKKNLEYMEKRVEEETHQTQVSQSAKDFSP
jgi:hypothetical protein